ncbi:unnamed protein product [Mytilus coruscus]|uniref:WSC domain-containing protein n=1 Tax=Mytilus coruscus TaxID=42192 RepID=A0A6J8AAE2_MYTCO|nr:unnamed protein product [Mytilus coruscus]
MHISLTKTTHDWFQARNKCSLIGYEHTNLNITIVKSDPIWTGDSARYLPWVEYLGCYELKPGRQLIENRTNVEPGTQLKECLLHCKQSSFIGLQQSNCVCLLSLDLTSDYLSNPCNKYPAKCQGDQTAFCGVDYSVSISDAFSVYKKVNVTERVDDGNCLTVDIKNNQCYYAARDCSATAFQICLNDSVTSKSFYQQNVLSETWIDSFNLCNTSSMLVRYSLILDEAQFSRRGTYWLSNTRRWIQGAFTNPEFCIAAKVQEDGHLERFPKRCETILPGLCVRREVTPTYVSSENAKRKDLLSSLAPQDATVTSNEASQYPREIPDRESNGNTKTSTDDPAPINKVLLISVIAATSLTFLVAIVIVILCIRMKRLQSNSAQNQILVGGKNVVYAQVERPMNQATEQHTVEDTYDHMDHRCLSQRPPQEESNYDMMSNIATVEENDYSHTNETDRERQCFIDASSEYSHVTIVAKPETRD